MRLVKDYKTEEEYLRDKIIMHNDKWRPLHHVAPYKIEYIKGNEPENQEPTLTPLTRTIVNRLVSDDYAKKNNIEIT